MTALRRLLRLVADDPGFALAILAAAALTGLAAAAGLPRALIGPALALLLALVLVATLFRDRQAARRR